MYGVGTQEPIRIPSATMMLTDDVADDASSLLVTRLMQTESSAGGTNSDDISRRTVASAAAAAAAAANTSLTDSVVRHADDGLADMSTQGATADNLHQLSLYICASFSDCCNLRKSGPSTGNECVSDKSDSVPTTGPTHDDDTRHVDYNLISGCVIYIPHEKSITVSL